MISAHLPGGTCGFGARFGFPVPLPASTRVGTAGAAGNPTISLFCAGNPTSDPSCRAEGGGVEGAVQGDDLRLLLSGGVLPVRGGGNPPPATRRLLLPGLLLAAIVPRAASNFRRSAVRWSAVRDGGGGGATPRGLEAAAAAVG